MSAPKFEVGKTYKTKAQFDVTVLANDRDGGFIGKAIHSGVTSKTPFLFAYDNEGKYYGYLDSQEKKLNSGFTSGQYDLIPPTPPVLIQRFTTSLSIMDTNPLATDIFIQRDFLATKGVAGVKLHSEGAVKVLSLAEFLATETFKNIKKEF